MATPDPFLSAPPPVPGKSRPWVPWVVGLVPAALLGALVLLLGYALLRQSAVVREQREHIKVLRAERDLREIQQEQVAREIRSRRQDVGRERKAICPYCNGEGFMREGSGHEIDQVKYGCPVCHGKGYNMLVLKPNQHACGTCFGMGLVGFEHYEGRTKTLRVSARVCQDCRGQGFGSGG